MLPLYPEKLAESRADREKFNALAAVVRERLGLSPDGGSFLGILVPQSCLVEGGGFETVVDQSPLFCFLRSGNLNKDEMEVVRWSMVDGSLSRIEGVVYFPFDYGKNYQIHFPRRDNEGEESVMGVLVEGGIDRVCAGWGDANYEEEWLYLNVYSWSYKKMNLLLEMLAAGDLESARKKFLK